MLRKFLTFTLLLLFVFSNIGIAFAGAPTEMTLLNKTVAVEKFFYGSEQTGALVERIAKLEKDIWGKENKDALMNRVDRMYSYCYENFADGASFLLKLNAVEWSLTHAVTAQPAKARIENIEHVLLGISGTSCFDERLGKLLKLAYSNGNITTSNVVVSKDSLVKIKLITPLSTTSSRAGDIVLYEATEDVYANGILVIAKGAQGNGKVNKVEQAKNFGRDAKLEASFDNIQLIDSTVVNTVLGDKAKEENKSLAQAAGASVVGMAVLGPVGIVGGAFVHGKEIEIPAGTEMYIQTKEETNTFGLQVK